MVGQDECATLGGEGVELERPELVDLGRALDQPAARQTWQVDVLLPVVETPVDRQLDDRRAARLGAGGEQVRAVGVHQARVVAKAVPGEDRGRGLAHLPVRTPPTDRANPGHPFERLQTPDQDPLLLGRVELRDRLVEVAVVGDLMTGVADRADRLRVALGAEPGDEEGRSDAAPFEDLEQARDPRPGPVRLMAHDRHPRRGLRRIGQDRALGVEIECERGRGPIAGGPAKDAAPIVEAHRPNHLITAL